MPVRKYIQGELFAHTIGYLGRPNQEEVSQYSNALKNNEVGKNGLERYYEEILSGVPGELIFEGNEIVQSKLPCLFALKWRSMNAFE